MIIDWINTDTSTIIHHFNNRKKKKKKFIVYLDKVLGRGEIREIIFWLKRLSYYYSMSGSHELLKTNLLFFFFWGSTKKNIPFHIIYPQIFLNCSLVIFFLIFFKL